MKGPFNRAFAILDSGLDVPRNDSQGIAMWAHQERSVLMGNAEEPSIRLSNAENVSADGMPFVCTKSIQSKKQDLPRSLWGLLSSGSQMGTLLTMTSWGRLGPNTKKSFAGSFIA